MQRAKDPEPKGRLEQISPHLKLNELHRHFSALAKLAADELDVAQSHSVEEADRRHVVKSKDARRR